MGNLIVKIVQPFFITNGDPVETWEFMSCMMEALGCQRSLSLSLSADALKAIQEVNM
jgi:hypothetical protein